MAEISAATAADAQQWAQDLLEAAGPGRKSEVQTTGPGPGSVMTFVVPDDVYEAVLAKRKEAEDAAAPKKAAPKKAASSATEPVPPPKDPPTAPVEGAGGAAA